MKIDSGDLNEHQKATPMTLVIQQRVHASPRALFEMVLDSGSTPGSHRENQPKIGQIGGMNLLLIPARMLVQAWRPAQARKKDVSFLVRKFSKAPGAWRVDLVPAGIPKYDHQMAREGW